MDIPQKAKDMVGNSYLFSGNYLDKQDRKEREHLIKDVKMTDTYIKDENTGDKRFCISFLIDFEGKDKWTKPLPVRE